VKNLHELVAMSERDCQYDPCSPSRRVDAALIDMLMAAYACGHVDGQEPLKTLITAALHPDVARTNSKAFILEECERRCMVSDVDAPEKALMVATAISGRNR